MATVGNVGGPEFDSGDSKPKGRVSRSTDDGPTIFWKHSKIEELRDSSGDHVIQNSELGLADTVQAMKDFFKNPKFYLKQCSKTVFENVRKAVESISDGIEYNPETMCNDNLDEKVNKRISDILALEKVVDDLKRDDYQSAETRYNSTTFNNTDWFENNHNENAKNVKSEDITAMNNKDQERAKEAKTKESAKLRAKAQTAFNKDKDAKEYLNNILNDLIESIKRGDAANFSLKEEHVKAKSYGIKFPENDKLPFKIVPKATASKNDVKNDTVDPNTDANNNAANEAQEGKEVTIATITNTTTRKTDRFEVTLEFEYNGVRLTTEPRIIEKTPDVKYEHKHADKTQKMSIEVVEGDTVFEE